MEERRKYYKEEKKRVNLDHPELTRLRRQLTAAILQENEDMIKIAEKELGAYLIDRKKPW